MPKLSPAVPLLAWVCAAGCTPSLEEGPGTTTLPVLYGTPSGADDDGVVQLRATNARGTALSCTGTLVAPNLVITARHCVTNFKPEPFACTADGELTPTSVGGETGEYVDPAQIQVRVGSMVAFNSPAAAFGTTIFAPASASICRNDIAAVLLDRSFPDLPLLPIRWRTGNERLERLRMVGYGRNETVDPIGTRRARSDVTIAFVGPSEFQPEGDPIVANTFETSGPVLCEGDSGGPAFTERGALTGVFSQFVGPCESATTRNIFTQVAPFASATLTEAFEAAGFEPILEAPPASGGSGGVGPADGGEGGHDNQGEGGEDAGSTGGRATAGAGGSGHGAGSSGQAAAGAPSTFRGPRTQGGCRCELEVGAPARSTPSLVPFLGLAVLLLRRTGRFSPLYVARRQP